MLGSRVSHSNTDDSWGMRTRRRRTHGRLVERKRAALSGILRSLVSWREDEVCRGGVPLILFQHEALAVPGGGAKSAAHIDAVTRNAF